MVKSQSNIILFDYFRLNRVLNYSVLNSVSGLAKILQCFDPSAMIRFPNISQRLALGLILQAPILGKVCYQSSYFHLNRLQKLFMRDIIQNAEFVYLYEGTPGIKRFLHEEGKTYIDFRVSPIRYNQELYLDVAVNKNCDSLSWLLDALREAQVDTSQNVLSYKEANPETLVFIGQKEGDVAMLDQLNGQQSWLNFVPDIVSLTKRYKEHIYRKHPLSNGKDLGRLSAIIGQLKTDNSRSVYDLFDGSYAFCALSSSVLAEAESFNLRTHRLMTSYPLVSDHDKMQFKAISLMKVCEHLRVKTEHNVRDLLGGNWSPAIE